MSSGNRSSRCRFSWFRPRACSSTRDHGALVHALTAALIGLALNVSATEYTAKWIGGANGEWKKATNWDINKVPNNTATDTYDVIWDSHPVVVTLTDDFTVRNFTFASGGTLMGSTLRTFTVVGALQWTDGLLAISGRTTVNGDATLQGTAAGSLILDGGVFTLKGSTRLLSTFNSRHGGWLVNDLGADFEAHENAGFVTDISNTKINNFGTFRILASAQSLPCISMFNWGVVEVAARSVNFQTFQLFDFDQREGELSLSGADLNGKLLIEAGHLKGNGHLRDRVRNRGQFSLMTTYPS